MRVRRFNESFNAEEYLDYLLSEVDEKYLSKKDSGEFFLYLEYDITPGLADKIDIYLKTNNRFNDVIVISKYDFDLNYHRILLVDRFFYSKNQKFLYKNIKWIKHPIAISMDKTAAFKSMLSGMDIYDRYQKAEKAVDIPEDVSIIRNLDRIGQIEIWNDKLMEDPIRVWEENTPELQYILFKYLGKRDEN
jgi:hypothetical protein